MRVLLVSMPFAALGTPSAALSVLKAGLVERGVDCHTAYLNFPFAEALGFDAYELIAERLSSGLLAGDWVFASCLFGERPGDRREYLVTAAHRLGNAERRGLSRARDIAPDFIEVQSQAVPWGDYDLIGFTSSGGQNVASLAMAHRVKEMHPQLVLAFGGAEWEATMGVAQLSRFTFVDVAFLGEADLSLPAVAHRLESVADRSHLPLDDVPGIAYRDAAGVHQTTAGAAVTALDALPEPDFSDYFSALADSGLDRKASRVHLWLQGSRGCWWAERHPCRFCGLNGSRRAYRTMSSSRLLDILRSVSSSWPGCAVDLADTVVSAAFLGEALPSLAADPLGVPLSVEARPELQRQQVRDLARAGGEVQLGIESLSTHVLNLMDKGSRVLECLRLLKWCRDEDLYCSWNIIYDVPGETDADLMEMVTLIPALHSLPAPRLCLPMQLDRFSPFFENALEFEIEGVRPLEAYRYVYPGPPEALVEIAGMWDYERDRSLLRRARLRRLKDEVRLWQEGQGKVQLVFRRYGQRASVVEARDGSAVRLVELDELDVLLYEACDDIAGLGELTRLATPRTAWRDETADDAEGSVAGRLRRLVREQIMVEVGGRYLSLASAPMGSSPDQPF